MEIYEIGYLFLGLTTLVAAGTIINYSRLRSASSPDPEIKRAFRPLYLFALGLIMFGIGVLLTFFIINDNITLWQETSQVINNQYLNSYTIFYVFTVLELLFLSISATIILKQRLLGIIMLVMIFIAYLLLYNAVLIIEASGISNVAENYINFGNFVCIILLGINATLFTWIAYDTKRSTSLALGYAMIVQVLAVPRLFLILPIELIIAISVIALMGPVMIAFAFLRPEQKISAELFGYGASFAVPVYLITSLLTTGLITELHIVVTAIFGVIAIMFASGTASYTYGRWRETKQLPTALLMIIFTCFVAGQTMGIFGNLGIIDYTTGVYFDLVASSFALIIFTVIALLASGYRTAASIPVIIYIPSILLMVQSYPEPVSVAFLNYWYLGAIVIVLFFLPIILFSITWRRMKRAGAIGRSRPLGMAIGLLLYIFIRFPLLLLEFPFLDPGYGFVSAAFLVFWLSITGRLERNKLEFM
ncbi:hypothetical protein EU527_14940 [Candidatus Thorarchaeota archaeon]|nr:MAG: hypothetical protein EU527_14940 [Candidatus Thorarchaeota archaeon]